MRVLYSPSCLLDDLPDLSFLSQLLWYFFCYIYFYEDFNVFIVLYYDYFYFVYCFYFLGFSLGNCFTEVVGNFYRH